MTSEANACGPDQKVIGSRQRSRTGLVLRLHLFLIIFTLALSLFYSTEAESHDLSQAEDHMARISSLDTSSMVMGLDRLDASPPGGEKGEQNETGEGHAGGAAKSEREIGAAADTGRQ